MDTSETQVQLNEIAQIALTVNSLAEAKAFYQDVLGMHFLFDAGAMSFFQCGRVRLMIGTSDKPVEPGGTILYEAHKALEQICIERDTLHYKQQIALRYAELVYYGQWFHPLREALQRTVDAGKQK